MPIATVGRNVGFDDQLYFSRVFKNAPGRVRASLGQVVNNKKEGGNPLLSSSDVIYIFHGD